MKFLLSCLLLVLSFLSGPCLAEAFPMDKFAELPILNEGRLKPLDSFARNELLKFSKKDSYNGQSAITWLAETLFNPSVAPNQTIFRVTNASTRHALGLEERKIPLYSFAEMTQGLEKTRKDVSDILAIPAKDQTQDQKDLLALHENALEYTLLLRSFSAVLPLNIFVPPQWAKKAGLSPKDPITYMALVKIQPEIDETVRGIIKRKGNNPARYTRDEQETAMLGLGLQTIAKASDNNALFKILPSQEGQDWVAPWEILNNGKSDPFPTAMLEKWKALALSWQDANQTQWATTIQDIDDSYFYTLDTYPSFKLWIEKKYNSVAPFTLSIFTYAMAMVLGFFSLSLSSHNATKQLRIQRLATASLLLSLLIQAAGLVTRIYLTERPPVGTLYESLLFVAFVAPLIALLMEIRLKNHIGLIAGSITGTMIGLLALSMAGEGDTMKMLGAVLNTRFWLTTHVLCITIGYGWCLVTSVLAHLLLIGRATGKMTLPQDKTLSTSVMTLALFSLLFTTVGTILGGIWADQSWGRFWGWDPKENGALLIVLWIIWFLHGKISGHFKEIHFLAGMAFLSVIVATAWIGVNLLGVGLHSYGFIEGVFWGLGGFALFEIGLIAALVVTLQKKDKLSHAA